MDIRIGDSFTLGPFKAQLTNGSLISLAGAEIEASVATARGATPLFTLQNTQAGGSDAEVQVTDELTATFYVYVSSARSSLMLPDTTYYLDARIKTITGLVATVGEAKWLAVQAYTPVPTP